jgi:hypothetical protein
MWCIGSAAAGTETPVRRPVLADRERTRIAVNEGASWCAARAATTRKFRAERLVRQRT